MRYCHWDGVTHLPQPVQELCPRGSIQDAEIWQGVITY